MSKSTTLSAITLIIATCILCHVIVKCCPAQEALKPCTCEWPDNDGSAYVTCNGLDNEQDLTNAAASLKGKNYLYSFVIENSIFNFIPSDAFKGLKFVELEIKETSFRALTDTDVAFEGLEDHLEILMMTDCTFMNEWDWYILRNLHKLMRLDIIGGDLTSIDEDLGKINLTSVREIIFERNQISFLDERAFSTFTNLRFLVLSDNKITDLKRSMFPNPADDLTILDLGHNLIEDFPSDIFSNMPILEQLSLNNNKILILSEKALAPVWEQLDSFTAMGNELTCDCRMSWILSKKPPKSLRAICSKPKEAKGKGLQTLTSKDLWCYV